jgi:hypothetical protein
MAISLGGGILVGTPVLMMIVPALAVLQKRVTDRLRYGLSA